MAIRDWNGDGKKDIVDEFFEYNIYKYCTKSNNSSGNTYYSGNKSYSGASGSSDGCLTSIAYIIAIVIVYGILMLFVPDEPDICGKIGCDRECWKDSNFCIFHDDY